MKSMLKDTVILFVITLIAGCLLGTVYEVTKEPIATQQMKAKNEACQSVFKNAASFEAVAVSDNLEEQEAMIEEKYSSTIDEVSAAKDDGGGLLGYVITVTDHEGYGGDIQFSIGVQIDGTLNGISFLSISETAGLGMRAEEVLSPQFSDKQVSQFSYTKTGKNREDQIDAISGATITTNAVVNGVNAGLEYFQLIKEEGGTDNE
jgi:electron transport complex protein RnfG